MPLELMNTTEAAGIHPPEIAQQAQQAAGGIPGEIYFAVVILSITAIAVLLIIYIIIRLWGSPILKAAEAKTSGNTIIQHFQNSKIGSFILGPLACGAIRHKKISDGTLITTPHGINTLEGLSFINSWSLLGISIPTFLIGGVSKLRERGIYTRDHLEYLTTPQPIPGDPAQPPTEGNEPQPPKLALAQIDRFKNIITEAYNFDDFNDILKNSKDPKFINLQIEYVGDFIPSMNPHYTEAEITLEVQANMISFKNPFIATIMFTAIAVFIVAIGMYILGV